MEYVQLYKTKKFKELTEDNRIKNTELNDVIKYILIRYENLTTFNLDVEYEDEVCSDNLCKCIVIAYGTSPTKYYWDYYINWNKIRKINGTTE
jgi:hypothetical protein